MLNKKPSMASLVVALVEDDRLLREETAKHLIAHDFVVHAVNSVSAFDDLAARVAIDLFVLDWNLPGESGLSLSRRLRETLPDAGIVLMTAHALIYSRSDTGRNENDLSILAVYREEQGKWRFLAWQSAKLPAPTTPAAKK